MYMYRIVSVCCWILPIHSLKLDKGTRHGSWKHVGMKIGDEVGDSSADNNYITRGCPELPNSKKLNYFFACLEKAYELLLKP